jgi:hypothetical protein
MSTEIYKIAERKYSQLPGNHVTPKSRKSQCRLVKVAGEVLFHSGLKKAANHIVSWFPGKNTT